MVWKKQKQNKTRKKTDHRWKRQGKTQKEVNGELEGIQYDIDSWEGGKKGRRKGRQICNDIDMFFIYFFFIISALPSTIPVNFFFFTIFG